MIPKKSQSLNVCVVLPAYNAEKTLKKTYYDIPNKYRNNVILVDDASHDRTTHLAKKLNLQVYRHKNNRGYGANQKTCYRLALISGADIVVMLHPDYQYDPKLIKYFVEMIADKYFDVMLGSRIRSRKEVLDGGMPKYKYYSNRFLTIIENTLSGHNLTEWHTGMRAYSSEVLKNIKFNRFSNDFVFDSQMLFAIMEKGYKIGEIPVPVRYFSEASSINFKRSLKYGLQTVREAFKYYFRKNKQSSKKK